MNLGWRRVAALGGVAAFVAAAVFLAQPGLAASVGTGRTALALVGVAALAGATLLAYDAWHADRATARPPEVERPPPAATPGDDLHAALESFGDREGGRYALSRTRTLLASAVVAVRTRYAGDTEASARERIAEGTWTDDPVAAAFLREDGRGARAGGPRDSRLVRRLRTRVGAETQYRRGVSHVADAVVALVGDGATDATTERRGAGLRAWFDGVLGPADRDDADRRVPAERDENRTTGRWAGVGAVSLTALGVGLLAERPAILLVAVVGVGFAAYARTGEPPAPTLTATRTVAETAAAPGERVGVELQVTNEGTRAVGDLRVVDGVAPGLGVVSGSARAAATLRPGETVTVEYAVDARRGTHEFGPALAVARDRPGTHEREATVPADGDDSLAVTPELRALSAGVPLRTAGGHAWAAGRRERTAGGVELHSVRDYRRGDPVAHVDWRRLARTGELSTVEFQAPRDATLVLVVDARPPAYVAPDARTPHAVDRSVTAAGCLLATLLDDGHRVGVAALGDGDCWLAPGRGDAHRRRARDLLRERPTPGVPAGANRRRQSWRASEAAALQGRLPRGAQVVFISPLTDAGAVRVARRLDAGGYPVAVVSPNPTATRTPGQKLAGVARRLRVTDLRAAGVPVATWEADADLGATLARFLAGWSP